MRLGWAKKENFISYYVHKTIRVDGKNKSLVIKRFGSEKYICETYGFTDAKAWAKEQVRPMNEAEKEDAANLTLNYVLVQTLSWMNSTVSMANTSSCRIFIMNSGWIRSAGLSPPGIFLSMI